MGRKGKAVNDRIVHISEHLTDTRKKLWTGSLTVEEKKINKGSFNTGGEEMKVLPIKCTQVINISTLLDGWRLENCNRTTSEGEQSRPQARPWFVHLFHSQEF